MIWVSKMMIQKPGLKDIFTKIDYVFKDCTLVNHVIARITKGQDAKGWRPESVKCFERLELLGDSVLNMVVSDMLFRQFPQEPRGFLTAAKQKMVCSDTLVDVSESVGLHEFFTKGKVESPSKGMLENAIEALIGAIYVDGGYFNARSFIVNQWKNRVTNSKSDFGSKKNDLQNWTQKNGKPLPRYYVIETKGPEDDLSFKIKVVVDGVGRSYGVGKSKREAETCAAFNLMNKIKQLGNCEVDPG